MTNEAYFDLLRDLNQTFDSRAVRDIPRAERMQVTAELEDALDRMIALVKPDLFLEVGAFEAEFSRRMKSTYPEVRAIALEANPRVHAHFADRLAPTGVEYLHLAADARTGMTSFFIPEMVAGKAKPVVSRMGSLNEIGLQDSEMTEVTVPTIALDELTRPSDAERICMWVDVEGAVDKVLAGAEETLGNTALVYCEIESRQMWKAQITAGEVIDRMERAGFFMAARDFQTNAQFNALFLKNDLAGEATLLEIMRAYAGKALAMTHELIASHQGEPGQTGA